MISTQASPQALPDPNVASLVPAQAQPQQGQSPAMDANASKAAMGNATYLASFLLPKKKDGGSKQDDKPADATDTPGKPQDAPGEEKPENKDSGSSGMEERLMRQIDELKGQITNNHQSDEINRIRQELTDLLKEDGEQE